MCDCVSINLKPMRASADMPPPLPNYAFGVCAVKKIIGPGLFRLGFRIRGSFAISLARADKLAFVSWPTPRTGNFQHYTIPING